MHAFFQFCIQILFAKDADQRSCTFEKSLNLGEEFKRRTRLLVLRAAVLRNQIHVKVIWLSWFTVTLVTESLHVLYIFGCRVRLEIVEGKQLKLIFLHPVARRLATDKIPATHPLRCEHLHPCPGVIFFSLFVLYNCAGIILHHTPFSSGRERRNFFGLLV